MSVAQKDGIKAASGISYEDLYQRWEQSNWQATAIDFAADREGWAGLSRPAAALGAVDLLDVLLRRGLGRRQPLPLHRRRAARGAEVLPRHPAGRRGAPRRLLSPLLQGGDRRRRLDRVNARLYRVRALLGLPRGLRPPRPDGRRPAPRPLVAELRPRDRAVPHGRRGDDGSARPALHRGLLRRRGDDARASARGWPTSRATSSATSASASRSCPTASPSREECKQAVAELLRELLPYTLAVFSPVDRAREYTRAYGFELEELFAFGLRSVRTKWRATGYPMEDMPGVLPVDPDLEPEEVARRQIVLLGAGIMGEPNGRPDSAARDSGALLRPDRPLGAQRSRRTAAADDPVALRRRRPVAPADRQRLDRCRARAVAGCRPDDRVELAGLDRDLDQGRRRAQALPAPAHQAQGLTARDAARGTDLPAAPESPRLAPQPRGAPLLRRCRAAGAGVVVEVYSNSSSAPNSLSSTALRRSSLRTSASTAPAIAIRIRRPQWRFFSSPRRRFVASRRFSAVGLEVLVQLLVVDRRVDHAAVRRQPVVGVAGRVDGVADAVAQILVLHQPPQVLVVSGRPDRVTRALCPRALRHRCLPLQVSSSGLGC